MADEKFLNDADEDDDDIAVTLTLDDGSTVECEILTIFTVGDRDYIALLPSKGDGQPDYDSEVFLYRYIEEEGEPTLENIDDDDEFDAASDGFDEWLDECEFDEGADESEA